MSTRRKDYVIDALDPSVRDGLEALNEFLTDPEWVKVRLILVRKLTMKLTDARDQVFHGANSDVVWLQRDFGLYIVGLFDTYHATKVLGAFGCGLPALVRLPVTYNLLYVQATLSTAWRVCSPCTPTLRQTSDTSWPTGGSGLSCLQCSRLLLSR